MSGKDEGESKEKKRRETTQKKRWKWRAQTKNWRR